MYDMYEEAGFTVKTEGATRLINSDAESRDEVDEIIETNVPADSRRQADQKSLMDFSTNQRANRTGIARITSHHPLE